MAILLEVGGQQRLGSTKEMKLESVLGSFPPLFAYVLDSAGWGHLDCLWRLGRWAH